ncbi:MAG TPA: hypothetical protein VMZ53_22260, partial [Kofleriaceae bacterium]|nr:hypothetical protein [Kofleriaceae bacterium]
INLVGPDHKEQCDGGTTGSPKETTLCNLDCTNAVCGDNKINQTAGEQCDSTSGVDSPTCNGQSGGAVKCKLTSCGDNFINGAAGETCDATSGSDSPSCNGSSAGQKACKAAVCGDNFLNSQAGETCDSSNGADTAGCNGALAGVGKACKVSVCGDNFVNPAANEQCDSSGGNDVAGCNGFGAGAQSCRFSSCGDNYLNPQDGEQCDASNGNNTPTCNGIAAGVKKCLFSACGDNFINPAAGETCDATNGADTAGCVGNSAQALTLGIACKASTCGDSYANPAALEDCDAAGADTSACNGVNAGTKKCKFATCGDNYVNPQASETCDSSSGVNTATCNGNLATPTSVRCKAASCGDTYRNSAAGEDCDTGPADSATCNGNSAGAVKCKTPACGDSHPNTQAGENCDDGNNATELCAYGAPSCSVCRAGCTTGGGTTQSCNDGVVQSAFETCDDGNASCGTCSTNCQVFASAQAKGSISVVRGNVIASGDVFRLDDGYNPPITFEYRLSGAAATGNMSIPVGSGDNLGSVRGKTRDAINYSVNIETTGNAGASETGTTATFTTTSNHRFTTGLTVVVSGVGVAGYNGKWVITGTPAADKFTVTLPTSGLAASGGGSVSLALDITATSGDTFSIVVLTNDHFSLNGNTAITFTASDPDFSKVDMQGGAGGDCDTGLVCRSNPDCDNGLCSSNACN